MYKATDKMCDLIGGNHESLQVLSRFGIALGFGDKTVEEVCEQSGVHTPTFLAVINYKLQNKESDVNINDISIDTLMDYLQRAHCYFSDFCLPMIRRKLIEAINCSNNNNQVAFHILKFFDEYAEEVHHHMEYENETVFKYVMALQNGENTNNYDIDLFARQHRAVDDKHVEAKLSELKNIIIKYYPSSKCNDLLNSALFDIFTCENDLAMHCMIEDNLFIPTVRLLETKLKEKKHHSTPSEEIKVAREELSEREKEILIEIVNGLSNKEIANKLFISPHTVITHRKNISRKLDIHTPAGLTIYAIANGIVKINDI